MMPIARTTAGSWPRRSAMPLQTPAMTLFSLLLSRLFDILFGSWFDSSTSVRQLGQPLSFLQSPGLGARHALGKHVRKMQGEQYPSKERASGFVAKMLTVLNGAKNQRYAQQRERI